MESPLVIDCCCFSVLCSPQSVRFTLCVAAPSSAFSRTLKTFAEDGFLSILLLLSQPQGSPCYLEWGKDFSVSLLPMKPEASLDSLDPRSWTSQHSYPMTQTPTSSFNARSLLKEFALHSLSCGKPHTNTNSETTECPPQPSRVHTVLQSFKGSMVGTCSIFPKAAEIFCLRSFRIFLFLSPWEPILIFC